MGKFVWKEIEIGDRDEEDFLVPDPPYGHNTFSVLKLHSTIEQEWMKTFVDLLHHEVNYEVEVLVFLEICPIASVL